MERARLAAAVAVVGLLLVGACDTGGGGSNSYSLGIETFAFNGSDVNCFVSGSEFAVRIQEPFDKDPNLSMLAKFSGAAAPADGSYPPGSGVSLEGTVVSGVDVLSFDGANTTIAVSRPAAGQLRLAIGPASAGLAGTIECGI